MNSVFKRHSKGKPTEKALLNWIELDSKVVEMKVDDISNESRINSRQKTFQNFVTNNQDWWKYLIETVAKTVKDSKKPQKRNQNPNFTHLLKYDIKLAEDGYVIQERQRRRR